MTPDQPPVDIVTVMITIAALIFSPTMSAIIGPYSVIITGAVVGSAWSASRRPPHPNRLGTLAYIAIFVVVALLVTVPLAILVARTWPGIEARWAFGPVAALIGGIGDDWPGFIKSALRLVRMIKKAPTAVTEAFRPTKPGDL